MPARMFTRLDYDLELDSIVFTSVSMMPSAVNTVIREITFSDTEDEIY